jgi:hypothetical protein
MPESGPPQIRVERIGDEGEPVVVVERFSPQPDRLVAEAASTSFEALGEFYPGVRARAPRFYFEDLASILAPVVREVFGYRERLTIDRALYSMVTTPPGRLSLVQRIPHIDGVEEGMIAVLHYLSPGDRGGTGFYRHISTGFETVDATRHRPYLDALQADFARHGEPAAGYIEGDTAIFSRTAYFAPTYNRALIYRSSLLHCASVTGDAALPADVHAGRLTIATFLSAR